MVVDFPETSVCFSEGKPGKSNFQAVQRDPTGVFSLFWVQDGDVNKKHQKGNNEPEHLCHEKKPWLFRVYRRLYYPVTWGL